MDINYKPKEIRELGALIDLAIHIAQPCSRELMRSYLDNLKTLLDNTSIKEVIDAGRAMLTRGEQRYNLLVELDQEPSSSVIKY